MGFGEWWREHFRTWGEQRDIYKNQYDPETGIYGPNNPQTAAEEGTVPQPEPPAPRDYSVLTGAQMASLGYGNEWYQQYQDVFNPQGTINDYGVYAGAPVAQGYMDENGQWVVTGPQMGAYQAYMLRSQDPYAWMQGQGMAPLSQTWGAVDQGLQALIDQILGRRPGSAEENAYTAERMGYRNWEDYTADLQGRRAKEQLGYQGQEGLTGEQESKLQRARGLTIQDMQRQAREMMGALAGQGRSIAAFETMDSLVGQIANYDAQQQIAIMNMDIAEQKFQQASLEEQLQGLTGDQADLATKYNEQLTQMQLTGLQGYATQITALNTEYGQFSDLWNQHAEAYYKSMMADLGLSEAAQNTAYENYAQYMLPYLDQMQIWNTQKITDLYDQLMNA